MSLKSKECLHKGCLNPVWSNGYCKNHIPKKEMKGSSGLTFRTSLTGKKILEDAFKSSFQTSLRKKPLKPKKYASSSPQNILKKEQINARRDLFIDIWNKRGHKSEVSGDKLYGEPSSAYFHHILPKAKYPEGDLDENNIIIMTMDEHANVESDIYRYEEVNRRRDILLKKYNLI